MSEIIKDNHSFVGYEYQEIVTNKERISFLIDGYKNFGWIVDENISHNISENVSNPYANVVLKLKRNRKIMNKMELTRLQRNFEFCIKEINYLEKSKTSAATMYALIVGITGIGFMAGSIIALMEKPPMIAFSVILVILAVICWILPCYIYKLIVKKRTEKVFPLIEEKQDEVFEICEKGSKLLY
ncbi:MAG: hypothetical protein ACERKZ_21155 [Lachnotalea sp.]